MDQSSSLGQYHLLDANKRISCCLVVDQSSSCQCLDVEVVVDIDLEPTHFTYYHPLFLKLVGRRKCQCQGSLPLLGLEWQGMMVAPLRRRRIYYQLRLSCNCCCLVVSAQFTFPALPLNFLHQLCLADQRSWRVAQFQATAAPHYSFSCRRVGRCRVGRRRVGCRSVGCCLQRQLSTSSILTSSISTSS